MVALRISRGAAGESIKRGDIADDRMQSHGVVMGNKALVHFPKVQLSQGPRRCPAANRNHGVRHAPGKWLAFIDDDYVPDGIWLDEIARAITASDVVEVKAVYLGRTDHPLEEVVRMSPRICSGAAI
jgi:cellulose synthase/poly-beta-1,6-N-acetylglucosamine synthase-like glycosyltransferase